MRTALPCQSWLRSILVWSGFVALAALACSTPLPADDPERTAVASWPAGRHSRQAAEAAQELFEPVLARPVGAGSWLCTFRLTLDRGGVEIQVLSESGVQLASRRLSRSGPHLVNLLVRSEDSEGLRFGLLHPAHTGPLDVVVESLELRSVSAEQAAHIAARLVHAFERETRRLGDPGNDNLVSNAAFEQDDELRGLPRHWSAFVAAEVDLRAHVLRASGAPPVGRPFLSTGPVRLLPGRAYRALCRLRVASGEVVLRAVDYDELVELAAAPYASPSDGETLRTLEFTAPEGARAARLWLAPGRLGESGDFSLHHIELELLPQNEE